MSIAVLGPKGTFSEEAAKRLPEETLKYVQSIEEVFDVVDKGLCNSGVVPIDNSLEGSVSDTVECLLKYELRICREVKLPIEHYLASNGSVMDIKTVFSHLQALQQCKKNLKKLLPKARTEVTASTAKAFELVSQSKDKSRAALGSKAAAEEYGLKLLTGNLSDHEHNETRFFVISKEKTKPTRKDKTSIVVALKHKPGSLYDFLGMFAKQGINLTKIESRPWRGKGWEYLFFIDFEGHKQDDRIAKLLSEVEKSSAFFKFLGSYGTL